VKLKGIRERSGHYEYNITYHGQRITGTADTITEAQRQRTAALNKIKNGETNKVSPIFTLSEAVTLTTKTRWRDTKGEATAIINATTALQFYGGETPIKNITTVSLASYVDYLRNEKHYLPSTINAKLATLSAVLSTALDHGHLDALPKIPRIKEYSGRIRYITEDEEAQALDLITDDLFRDAFIFLIDTGIRCGELLSLKPQDYTATTGHNGTITLWETKGNKMRIVPLTRRAQEIIERRKSFDLTKEAIRQQWQRLKKDMALDHDDLFVPHILRHTCASRLAQRGIPLIEIQKWLGHSTILTTMRYSHLAPNSIYDAVTALEIRSAN
jgi:integrase